MRKICKTIFLFTIITLFLPMLFAEETVSENETIIYEELLPERFEEIESGTKVFFKTSVQKAQVFLNSEYQGLTPLEIKDLIPGSYRLTLKKKGYDEQNFSISITSNHSDWYYVEMIKAFGTITFKNVNEESRIFLDGKPIKENSIRLEEGLHQYKINTFGYNPVLGEVKIEKDKTEEIEYNLVSSELKISNFNVVKKSKKQINFIFAITKKAPVVIEIFNMQGEEIKTFVINDIIEENVTIIWDKTDKNFKPLKKGTYEAVLSSTDFKTTKKFTL